jgi:hypothetical protein
MGDEDFLNALEEANVTEAPEEAKELEAKPEHEPKPEETPKDERPRDEHGRFAPKEEPKPADPPAPTVQPEAEAPKPQPEPGFVPLAALLDARDKAKAAEERAARLEAQRQQAQPVQVPDMFEDPEGYQAFMGTVIEQRLYGERLAMSERIARLEHGAETLAQAKEWGLAKCDADPYFNQKVRQSQDPYAVVIDEWKRENAAAIPADELEQFRKWKAAQAQLSGQQPPASPAPPNPSPAPPAIPPRSLASAPSAGDVLRPPAKDDKEVFEEVFPERN